MSASEIERTLIRLAHEIVEKNNGVENLTLVGIKRRGVPLAARLGKLIHQIEKTPVAVGTLDITLYRDDLSTVGASPVIQKATDADRFLLWESLRDLKDRPGFGFAADDCPVDRYSAAIFRQQRAVDVECAPCRGGEQCRAEHVAVVKGENEVRPGSGDAFHHFRQVRVMGGDRRDVVFLRDCSDAFEPDVLCRVVPMCHHQRDFEPACERGLQAA